MHELKTIMPICEGYFIWNVLSLFNPGAHGFLNVVNRMRKSEFVEHLNVLKRFSIGGLYI